MKVIFAKINQTYLLPPRYNLSQLLLFFTKVKSKYRTVVQVTIPQSFLTSYNAPSANALSGIILLCGSLIKADKDVHPTTITKGLLALFQRINHAINILAPTCFSLYERRHRHYNINTQVYLFVLAQRISGTSKDSCI